MKTISTTLGLAISLAPLAIAGSARAVDCLDLENPVITTGASSMKLLFAELGPRLNALSGAEKMTIVYQQSTSCIGMTGLAAGMPLTGTAIYWLKDTPPGTPLTCDLPLDGADIELSMAEVYPKACDGVDAAKIKMDKLFVLGFGYVVPTASDQYAIDAREGYYAYGLGPAGRVAPWVNRDVLFQRDNGSATQVTIFTHAHLKAGTANGLAKGSGGDMVTAVASATDPQAALGILALDVADTKRGMIDILAYRHWGQKKYYWPDSSASSFDKVNLRDGHYPLWAYTHALRSSTRVHARADELVGYLNSEVPLPEQAGDFLQLVTQVGLIPLCAMKVERDDLSDFTLAKPEKPCGCFFERHVPMGKTSCSECADDAECADGQICSFGYCETTGSK